ncbi:hypothetical protein HNY73_010513 [Argiope bruennichi]|uniref:Uncharacterized protein n=1 Tax=Argiope bruennichi TaxID=94029 RepID=A0A8T0F248_ARGBR|nr:hypothetical protein HNY73_010513 [Argiope bruennichi]
MIDIERSQTLSEKPMFNGHNTNPLKWPHSLKQNKYCSTSRNTQIMLGLSLGMAKNSMGKAGSGVSEDSEELEPKGFIG